MRERITGLERCMRAEEKKSCVALLRSIAICTGVGPALATGDPPGASAGRTAAGVPGKVPPEEDARANISNHEGAPAQHLLRMVLSAMGLYGWSLHTLPNSLLAQLLAMAKAQGL